jgi:hypothetical protein
MKKSIQWMTGLLLVLAFILQLSGHGYIWKALYSTYLQGHRTAHIDDAHNFDQRVIAKGAEQAWPRATNYNQQTLSDPIQHHHQQYETAAFLVAQHGQLVHEQYFAPYNAQSRTNSFSVAKTITTMQVGMAVQQGFISSFDAPITDQIKEYANDPRGNKATVAQLASMKSGHEWDENYYLPLNMTTDLYYGKHAEALVLSHGFEREPGSEYEYSSGTTQVLGVFLKRALQAKEPTHSLSVSICLAVCGHRWAWAATPSTPWTAPASKAAWSAPIAVSLRPLKILVALDNCCYKMACGMANSCSTKPLSSACANQI